MNVEYVQVTMSQADGEKYSRPNGSETNGTNPRSKSHSMKTSRTGGLTPFGVNKEDFWISATALTLSDTQISTNIGSFFYPATIGCHFLDRLAYHENAPHSADMPYGVPDVTN